MSKKTFEELALPSMDGSFYLRPDNIFGAAVVDPSNMPMVADGGSLSLEEHDAMSASITSERAHDLTHRGRIEGAHAENEASDEAIAGITAHVASPSPFPRPLSESLETEGAPPTPTRTTPTTTTTTMIGAGSPGSGDGDDPSASELLTSGGAQSFRRLPKSGKRGVAFADVEEDGARYPESMLGAVVSRASDVEVGTENPFALRRGDRNMTVDQRPSMAVSSQPAARPSVGSAIGRDSEAGGHDSGAELRPSIAKAASSELKQLKRRQQQQQQQQRQRQRQQQEEESHKRESSTRSVVSFDESQLSSDQPMADAQYAGYRNDDVDDADEASTTAVIMTATSSDAAEHAAAVAGDEGAAGAAAGGAGGWSCYSETSSGRPYWHNSTTGVTTWDEPAMEPPPAAHAPSSLAAHSTHL